MANSGFTVGDLIWGKMKGFPPWPGEIYPHPENMLQKRSQYYVYFFGCNMWGWLDPKNIQHHDESLVQKYSSMKKKRKTYEKAITEIIEAYNDRKNSEYCVSSNILQDVDTNVDVLQKSHENGENILYEPINLDNLNATVKSFKVNKTFDTNSIFRGKELKVVLNKLSDSLISKYSKRKSDETDLVLNSATPNRKHRCVSTGAYLSNSHNRIHDLQKKRCKKVSPVSKVKNVSPKRNKVLNCSTSNYQDSETNGSLCSPKAHREINDVQMQNNTLQISENNFSPFNKMEYQRGMSDFIRSDCSSDTHSSERTYSPHMSYSDISSDSDSDRSSFHHTDIQDEDYERMYSSGTRSSDLSDTEDFSVKEKYMTFSESDNLYDSGILFENNVDLNPSLLFSPSNYPDCPEDPCVDFTVEVPKLKNISPTKKRIGFLGLGRIGQIIVKNLIESGHLVTIWNRTARMCDMFSKAIKAKSPAEVVQSCDIIFSCLSNATASKHVFFMKDGVKCGLQAAELDDDIKGFVELTSLDPDTTKCLSESVHQHGGRFLEAPLHGSKEEAQFGNLLIVAAGEKSLFDDCDSCFCAISRNAFFLKNSTVGNASSYSILNKMVTGSFFAVMAEAITLAEKLGLKKEMFIDLLAKETFFNTYANLLSYNHFDDSGNHFSMPVRKPVNIPLRYIQSSISTALKMSDAVAQAMPITTTVNEIYKRSKLLKYANHDVTAICNAVRQ